MKIKKINEQEQKTWQQFVEQEELNEQQQKQFLMYLTLLKDYNRSVNLTAIDEPEQIMAYHFQDSLALSHCMSLESITTIIDVGSGAGFPGIPLKIRYPHLQVILIEVNLKKIEFLHEVIAELGLTAIEVYTADWRTFLRNTKVSLDLVIARASLQPEELMRMFKPSCLYKQATLVYWAAKDWQPTPKEQEFIQRTCPYVVGNKKRKLVFFSLPKSST